MTTREIRQLVHSAVVAAVDREGSSGSPRRRAGVASSHGSKLRTRSGRASPAITTSTSATATVTRDTAAVAGPFTTLLDRPFWPVPTDNTLRIGDAVTHSLGFYPAQALPDLGPLGASSLQPFAGSGQGQVQGQTGKELHMSMGSGDRWFGFGSSMRLGREIVEPLGKVGEDRDGDGDALWSRYEPFRFSVEFWGIDLLGEKERAYSHTVFHAGQY
jgi:hypothetical protein